MPQQYDVAVIGAGLGGLTAAALLARAGRKVLVVERNASVGGAASTYKVKELVVEAALHETSDPRHPADPKHDVFKRIGILDALEWVPTGALFEVRGGPVGAPFALPSNVAEAREALTKRFPASRAGIAAVLAAIEASAAGASDTDAQSLSQVLDRELGDDEAAKCALAANLALYHDDPGTLGFGAFAAAQGAYLTSGSCFVKGGSQRLSNALRRVIQQGGGSFLFKRRVTAIMLGGDGRPAGLVHEREGGAAEIAASVIVSNAAPHVLAALLPEPTRARLAATYEGRALSTSVFSATIGLSRAPAEFGLSAYSTVLLPSWMTTFADYVRGSELVPQIPDGTAPPLIVANYAAIDSGLGGPPHPVCVLGVDRMANWDGIERPAFEALRARVLDGIVAAVDREYPGFASAVMAKSLNTASSMSSYLNAPQGAIYGFAPLPSSHPGVGESSALTPVPGIYLASAYAAAGGFNGAITGGAAAADAILTAS